MRYGSRIAALIGSFLSLAAGCSKPVSTVLGPATVASGAAASDPRDLDDAPGIASYRVRLHFVGPVVTLDREFRPTLDPRADFYVRSNGGFSTPLDTVPAHSVLKSIRWRRAPGSVGNPSSPDSTVYFDDVPVFAATTSKEAAGQFTPGIHILNLRVPVRAGGGTLTVVFDVDFPPGAWWAGPDPERFPRASDGDGRAVDVTDWAHFTTTPAWPPDGRRYFGPDSFGFVPSLRRPVRDDFPRRTFYEIYGDRIYARSEGDTAHLNAWVVFCTGGFDRDSRYEPTVEPGDPALPPGFASQPERYPVLISQGFIGAPSAFRSLVLTKLDNGEVVHPSETISYPDFNPASGFRNPHLAGYWRTDFPGKAYAEAIGVDAEGVIGRINDDIVMLADRVDAGGGSPSDRLQRQRILTFHVRPAVPTRPAGAAEASAGGVRGEGRRH